ncbi:MAG: methyltransferase domain-containing protein, partial [Desulfovibrionaceae bacterium]|nr:methyltransferase domain-containing protein [Desulfovibrionaceae bacterium]
MTDDRGTSGDFQAFSATCAGQCLAAAEEALVRRALAVWPEQGPTLLEINCGAGLLQRPLRAMGFDVTGCEGSPALREAFARSLGIRHVADPAVCDLLPYGDGSFDWALLHLERGASSEQVEKALAEAGRTALRGLAVLFWNRLSLAGLTSGSLPLLPLSSWSLQRRLASLAV